LTLAARSAGATDAMTLTVSITTATANEMWVIRADVAGQAAALISHGSTANRIDRPSEN
jgi:hypothetical protein